jgi:hypothetical protein
MATLTTAKQKELWAELMQALSSAGETAALTKPDLLAAVTALDAFMDTNASAINNAIPQPARSALTTAQKARLLMLVLKYRYTEGA